MAKNKNLKTKRVKCNNMGIADENKLKKIV
jgi:hypothetical protein